MSERLGFETRAIHSGQPPDPATGAVVTPIYQTSTYAQEAVGRHRGYEYSRTANPTRTALERCLADLEGAGHGFAFASGMAAEDAVLRLLPAGSHVVLPHDVYGGTYRLVAQVLGPAGMAYTATNVGDLGALEAAWRDDTRLVWVETPTNPMLEVVDIAVVARQMAAFGGMVSFTLAGGEDAALAVVAATRLFTLAESLGAVESLIEHPARMTHASVAGSELAVDPALVRLSVGIETEADLVADLRNALDKAG